MSIFSAKVENPGRQPEVDLSRGFGAVLIMIVHVGLFLGNNITKGLWTFCDIVGSEPCAPVFMAMMGISMVYSRHQRPLDLLQRGIRLLVIGYALNFFRSILPLWILGNVDEWASIEAFFVVDILQFAGVAFMLIGFLKQLKVPNIALFALSVVMVVIDQFIMLPKGISWKSELLTGIVNLFCPVTKWSCFPLLTWFIFPAFGLVFGDMLKHCTCKNRLYGILLPVSLVGTAYVYGQFYRLYPDYTNYYWGNNFYYMGLTNALLTLLIISFFLSFWFFAEKRLPNILKRGLRFLSVNLNVYYVASWIVIIALMHAQALGGWRFNSWQTILLMPLLIFGCVWMTKLWLFVRCNFLNRQGNS